MKILYAIAPPSINYDSQKYFITKLYEYCIERNLNLELLGPKECKFFPNLVVYPVDDRGMFKFVSGSGGFFKYTTRVGFEMIKMLYSILDKGFYQYIMLGEMSFLLPFQLVDLNPVYYTHVDMEAIGNKQMEHLMNETLRWSKFVIVTQQSFNYLKFSMIPNSRFIEAPIPIEVPYQPLDEPSYDILYSGTGSIGDELENIIEYTKDDGQKWTVVLYGPRDMEREQVQILKNNKVNVMGRMERKWYLDFVRKFRCYVSFSDVETYGMRILEAAHLVPVVIWNKSVLYTMYKGVFESFSSPGNLYNILESYKDTRKWKAQIQKQLEFVKQYTKPYFYQGLDRITSKLKELYHPETETVDMIRNKDKKLLKWDIYSLQRLYQVLDRELQIQLQEMVGPVTERLF